MDLIIGLVQVVTLLLFVIERKKLMAAIDDLNVEVTKAGQNADRIAALVTVLQQGQGVPEAQVAAVVQKLKDLNTQLDGIKQA